MKRCEWAEGGSELMVAYHDDEWGVPSRDDVHLFEMLTLEGAQAGLSWNTILNKRQGYRAAFAGFDAVAVARFGKRDVDRLMKNPGIVRNRSKIESTISNANAILALEEPLSDFVWSFTKGKPVVNRFERLDELPAKTEVSIAMSKALAKRGFRFVGPTICYAFMQAVGIVDDHTIVCFRRRR
ncbi:MAG TPA: DNA-3-methyladenine glycosylase I [Actinomycetota bacterium]|nr:DNA-3-methyladenine glycosylase I [Actinomycetota bacterium]